MTWVEVDSPYDGTPVARVPKAGAAEVRRAIDAAARAMESPLPAHERAEILVRVAGALGRRADEAAHQIAAEAGKPLKAARVEVARAMSTYTMAAVAARTLTGEMVPMDASAAGEGKMAFTVRRPIGVVARSRRSTSRSTSSRTRSRRRSRQAAPSCSSPPRRRRSRRFCWRSSRTRPGCRPGWLNVVVGPASEIGDVLIEDERVKLVTFTGSSAVGWSIRERAPKKKVNLELGNATPVIVEADADVEDAAARCAANAFSFAGQSCISVQRIYVHPDVYDEFKERFLPKVGALVVGDPADEAPMSGR